MRRIVNYIRQCFCQHEYELISKTHVYSDYGDDMPTYIRRVYRCKKCGYVQKIKL